MSDHVQQAIEQLLEAEGDPGIIVSGVVLCFVVYEDGREGVNLLPTTTTRPHEGLGLLTWGQNQYLRILDRRTGGGPQ